jgi:alkaline phosphatase
VNIIGGSRVTDAALSARIATGLGAAQVRNGVVGGQQPFNNLPPLNTYPSGPLNRDTTGNFLVTGQVGDAVAARAPPIEGHHQLRLPTDLFPTGP